MLQNKLCTFADVLVLKLPSLIKVALLRVVVILLILSFWHGVAWGKETVCPAPEPFVAIRDTSSQELYAINVVAELIEQPLIQPDDNLPLVMVNFWASWCPSCLTELPVLASLSEDLPIVVLAANINDSQDQITTILSELNLLDKTTRQENNPDTVLQKGFSVSQVKRRDALSILGFEGLPATLVWSASSQTGFVGLGPITDQERLTEWLTCLLADTA